MIQESQHNVHISVAIEIVYLKIAYILLLHGKHAFLPGAYRCGIVFVPRDRIGIIITLKGDHDIKIAVPVNVR